MPPLVPFLFPALAAGSIGAAVAGMALNLVGSLIVAKVTQRPTVKAETQAYGAKWGGINVSSRGAAVPRDLLYGRTRAGGTIVYMATSGFYNQYLHLVVALSSCRVKSIGAVYFGSKMAVDADGTPQDVWAGRGTAADELPDLWFHDGEANLISIQKRLGTVDQSAFAGLIDASNGGWFMERPPPEWTSAHRLQGVACVYLRLTYAPSSFPQGLPDISFDVEGCDEVVDPRTGATVYSTNPALCLAHFMAHPQFGFGTAIGAADGLNTAALIEAANICDEAVALRSGGAETRYTLNGAVSLAQDPMTTTREMLSAMAGTMADISGQFHIHAGAYRLPVMDLGLGDARGPLRITTRLSMADNFNAVRGKFISPANDWQPDDFPPYQSAVYLAEDNNERIWRDIELPFTNSASMAQRLAKIELERARRQISLPFPAQLPAWAVPVGETVTLTHALRGWASKPFVVVRSNLQLETVDGPALATELTLQETSPLIYDWSASEEKIYAAAPRSNLPSAFDPPPAPAVTSAVESLYTTREGAGVKAQLRLEWSASDATAVRYRLQGRRAGDWENIVTTSGLSAIIPDIAPGNWQFRVVAISAMGVQSDWSETRDQVVMGLGAVPTALRDVSGASLGGLILLRWAPPDDLDVIYGGSILVRHSSSAAPAWENSSSVETVAGRASNVATELMAGTYLLRACDSTGNVGPVSSVYTDGIQALPYATTGMLQEDDEFSGSKSGTAAVDGALMLDSPSDIWAGDDIWAVPDIWTSGEVVLSGIYEFAAGFNFGAVKTVRLQRVVEFYSLALNTDIWAGSDIWTIPDVWGSAEGGDVSVEIATTQTDPSSSATWSEWRRLGAAEITAWGIKARAILSTGQSTVSPAVTKLRVISQEVV